MVSIPGADFQQPSTSGYSGLYEQPLSERMRTLLRLEFLYQQLCFNIEQPSEWGSRSAITNLLDIVTILGRGDVRGDVLRCPLVHRWAARGHLAVVLQQHESHCNPPGLRRRLRGAAQPPVAA